MLFLFTALLQVVDGLSLPERQAGLPRVVQLDLQRNTIRNPVAYDNSRLQRRGYVQATLENEETLYFFNASIGTPPQAVRFHIDTGSSDMWVNTASSRLCSKNSRPCSDSSTYSANHSSTYEYLNSKFNISYADGSGATGDYATDVLSFSGQNISSLQFGIGYQSTSNQNVLGIGYDSNEAQVALTGTQPYLNLPAKMASDKIIATNAYSLWLNDLDANTGSILFGGIDQDKFEGNLVTLPIQKTGDSFSEFLITMTGLDMGSKTVASDMTLAVLLDSGTSLTYLPDDVTSAIYNVISNSYGEIDTSYLQSDGVVLVPCSIRDQSANITFKFSSPASISVPLSEMVLDADDGDGTNQESEAPEQACILGIVPSGSSSGILGDTFLRSAYVVYDLDNNEISLANTKFNVTTSNVLEITSTVPAATKASNPVAATSGLSDGGNSNNGSSQNENGAAGMAPSLTVALLGLVVGGLIYGV